MKLLSEYLQSQAAAIGGFAAERARELEAAAGDAVDTIANLQAAVSNERDVRVHLERELASARKVRFRCEAALRNLREQISNALVSAETVISDVKDREETAQTISREAIKRLISHGVDAEVARRAFDSEVGQ